MVKLILNSRVVISLGGPNRRMYTSRCHLTMQMMQTSCSFEKEGLPKPSTISSDSAKHNNKNNKNIS